MLSENNKRILLECINELIEHNAKLFPEEVLSEESRVSISTLKEKKFFGSVLENKEGFSSYLEKVLILNSRDLIFELLSIIDGVSDPKDPSWTGIEIVDKEDKEENKDFLHDEF